MQAASVVVQRGCLVVALLACLSCLSPLVAAQITCEPGQGILRTLPAEINQTVLFEACGPAVADGNGTTYEYSWSFGDGVVMRANDSSVSHFYAKPGIYDITLNVTHNNTVTNYTSIARIFDCTGNASSEIVVQGNRTKDSLVTVWACIPERTNPNYTITYSWDFGDKSVDVPQLRRNQVLQHIFNATGSFVITVSVDLDGDIGTVEKTYNTTIKISSRSTPAKSNDSGLSGGDIAGIVTGVIVGVVLLTVAMGMVLNFIQERRKKRTEAINASTNYELLIEDGV